MKKELKSGILSADKSADGRPTVGGANVIAVLRLMHNRRSFDETRIKVHYGENNTTTFILLYI